ncbi:hypothetical protein EC991_007415, partial [Linnemannia zychae]
DPPPQNLLLHLPTAAVPRRLVYWILMEIVALKANDEDATGRGKFADGVSESEGHQILLSESSKLYRAMASKAQDDK